MATASIKLKGETIHASTQSAFLRARKSVAESAPCSACQAETSAFHLAAANSSRLSSTGGEGRRTGAGWPAAFAASAAARKAAESACSAAVRFSTSASFIAAKHSGGGTAVIVMMRPRYSTVKMSTQTSSILAKAISGGP